MILLYLFPFILAISFLIIISRNILYLTFLWQLKEYRLDRLLAHFKSPQGKNHILGLVELSKWMLFLGIVVGIYSQSKLIEVFYTLFWFVWIFEAIKSIRELILQRWRLPAFTAKIFFILLAIILVILFALVDINFSAITVRALMLGPFIDRFLWLLISMTVGLFSIPSVMYRKIVILQAKRKILNLNRLTVIGITGSFGKTSTKEFLSTILSEKFKVAKTPEFTNTDIGVAKYILKELNNEYQVFVVEMGAYKKGEIKEICNMVKPKVGIITGINEQHLELFGSIENTMKTKFELIESLPKDGIAIFNGNNRRCRKMGQWAKNLDVKILSYDITRDAKNIRTFTDHVEFTYVSKKKNYLIKANLLGRQTIENLLAAFYAAQNLGLTWEEIQKGVSIILPAPQTMKLGGKLGGMSLVDDTFNANPDGVSSAADFMQIFKGKKILVLTPLIELGHKAEEIHARLGEKLAKICDLILLTNLNYNKSFIDGTKGVSNEEKVQVVNTTLGVKLIRENLDEGGVVLFEGKEARRILNVLVKLD